METKRNREALARMTPEQRAAVEAIRAKHKTPEYRAEEARIREQVRKEIPPLVEPDSDLAALLEALKAERERRGLSLTDVSELTGMDRAMISRLENGRTPNPTWATLRAYARAIGLARLEVGLSPMRAGGAARKP